jgi:two-component system response regulator PilR (NtrC family)
LKRTERTGAGGRATAPQRCVLVVDDEVDILELIELTLLRMGLDVERAMGVKDAATKLAGGRHYDLCLTDMRLPDGTGLEIVEQISRSGADLPVAVITAHGNTENAVAALKAGAFDYVSKPVSLEQLRTLVKSALSLPKAGETKAAEQAQGERGLLGESPAILNVRALIEKLARSEAPVHITGESGSGKELAARLIHQKSVRREKPFVPVNCGAIPENLMESEFFGYRKGAFTGADADRDGFFQAAHGGTLFLDEVADLPLAMQVKLLRAIQEKKVRKVGSTQEEPVDVRIISATHQNLADCVESGKFRHDLYYRLNVIELRMPALRDMREDIPAIASSILDKLAQQTKVPMPRLEPHAMLSLAQYDFPGNVRELENILERAMALCDGQQITTDDLQLTPPQVEMVPTVSEGGGDGGKWPLQEYLDRVEKEAILEALEKTRYNRTAAAKLLGITFRAMRYRMERLGIN